MDRPSTAICLGPDPAGWAIDPAMLQFPEDLFLPEPPDGVASLYV